MKDNEKTNPNCFGEGDRNLPNCECRLIYERIRNAKKSVPPYAVENTTGYGLSEEDTNLKEHAAEHGCQRQRLTSEQRQKAQECNKGEPSHPEIGRTKLRDELFERDRHSESVPGC